MIAIQTKYIPPTTTKGSRIKAFVSSAAGHIFTATVPFSYDLNYEMIHYEAVKALVKKHKLDWDISNMTFGNIKDGYVFCFSDSKVRI